MIVRLSDSSHRVSTLRPALVRSGLDGLAGLSCLSGELRVEGEAVACQGLAASRLSRPL